MKSNRVYLFRVRNIYLHMVSGRPETDFYGSLHYLHCHFFEGRAGLEALFVLRRAI